MIERFYLKNNLSFDTVQLELAKGLVVFTGPSGSGKSVLFDAFLSIFGLKDAKAQLIEVSLTNQAIVYEDFAIDAGDEIIIKELKKDKVRYLLNDQSISKNALSEFAKIFVKHLHVKDSTEFEPKNILHSVDEIAYLLFNEFKVLHAEFCAQYKIFEMRNEELQRLQRDAKNLNELKEFLSFEIQKIESIKPKIGEYEALQEQKKQISKKEKMLEAINACMPIFDYVSKVSNALDILDIDSTFFENAIGELSYILETKKETLEELDESDIEHLLDRIEKLAALNRRFGGIQEALDFLNTKKEELARLENITFAQENLHKEIAQITRSLEALAQKMTNFRLETLKHLTSLTNTYLEMLYLPPCSFELSACSLNATGVDVVSLRFADKNYEKLSSGEFNRLRLSYLAALSELTQKSGGILFLDEVDANLSGKESFAIAKVLQRLAKTYQIFAISHQPQLTSIANQHFLVYKEDENSYVKLLSYDERVEEISRMISAEHISEDAKKFAINLLQESYNQKT